MCISEKLIIAILGPSCTGKTSIAEPLSRELGLPLRSCGTEIKRVAKEMNLTLGDLPDAIHSDIDSETRNWVMSQGSCIVEGRFLDYVLAVIKDKVQFIKLTASESERVKRLEMRQNQPFTIEDLQKIDYEDCEFRTRNYGSCSAAQTLLDVDTSKLTVEECVYLIKEKILPNHQ